MHGNIENTSICSRYLPPSRRFVDEIQQPAADGLSDVEYSQNGAVDVKRQSR